MPAVPPSPSPLRRPVVGMGAGVVACLVAAAAAGWALAGPPTGRASVPPPPCPGTLAAAVPRSGPGPADIVPWGPSSGRVCVYPGASPSSPSSEASAAASRPLGTSAALDATMVAELGGLLHPLPDAPASCVVPAGSGGADGGADGGTVSVVVLRYRPRSQRPRTAPDIAGTQVRLVLRSVPCATASNGGRKVAVPPDVVRRLTALVPALDTTFRAR